MCRFWSSHLNVATPSSEPWATKPSMKKAPNENLGREMVELHSVDASRVRSEGVADAPGRMARWRR
jgi:uncharacterized protein (DUF1800 family)